MARLVSVVRADLRSPLGELVCGIGDILLFKEFPGPGLPRDCGDTGTAAGNGADGFPICPEAEYSEWPFFSPGNETFGYDSRIW